MINSDGTLTQTGSAFQAVASLNSTPERLEVSGSDTTGLGVLAGANDSELRIVISNYMVPEKYWSESEDSTVEVDGMGTFHILGSPEIIYQNNAGYNLTIHNIPFPSNEVVVERYRIDQENNLALIDSQTYQVDTEKTVDLSAEIGSPSVELIVVKASK